MAISMALSLISTRIILNTLGIADFGIFNLIGGFVGTLSFLNSSMTVATQRFLSFSLGSGDNMRLSKIFNTSFLIHSILGLSVILLMLFIGFAFFRRLNIPPERFNIALIVFYVTLGTTFLSILSVPFDGILISHENFLAIAIFELFLSFSKLAIAILLLYSGLDKLQTYSVLTGAIFFIQFIMKQRFCSKMYHESRISPGNFDKSISKEMLSFSGWSLFGALASIARNQGIAIVMNSFFGIVVNTAYGISHQVSGQVLSLSTTVNKAINPQLAKSEGAGDRSRMLQLSLVSSKIPFMLSTLMILPIIIEMPYLLKIWLKVVPENAVIFTRLSLVLTVTSTLSFGIIAAISSIGKIKIYQLTVGSLLIMTLILTWFAYILGVKSYYAFIIAIFIEIVAHFVRLWFLHTLTGINLKKFIIEVDLLPMTISIFSVLAVYYSTRLIEHDFIRLIIVTISTSLFSIVGWYMIALNDIEKLLIKSMIQKLVLKVKGIKTMIIDEVS
jgi:O-antigen/teichoic acid export membrane protein